MGAQLSAGDKVRDLGVVLAHSTVGASAPMLPRCGGL